MKKKKAPMIMLTICLSREDWYWVDRVSKEIGVSKPAFVRGAISLVRKAIEEGKNNMIPEEFDEKYAGSSEVCEKMGK